MGNFETIGGRLLDVWERGRDLAPLHRSLLLLSAAGGRTGAGEVVHLPVGERDARLGALRRQLFGAEIVGVALCGACGESVEAEFELGDIRLETSATELPFSFELVEQGDTLEFRLPNSADLAAAISQPDPDVARRTILGRCLLAARGEDGRPKSFDQLSVSSVESLARAIAERDPRADIELSLSCPSCDHRWKEPFDIGDYLWRELDRWAEQTLDDVHELARAYGWSEPQVLALGAARRRAYLERIRR